jgi:hypothetical protein
MRQLVRQLGPLAFHHGTHLIGNNFDFRGVEDDSMDSLKLGRHH